MKQGFTLLELLIVIVVIGILAGIALPQFTKTKEHALGKEAIANLKLIAAAEKIYKMEMGQYYPPGSGWMAETDITNINTALKLFLTETNWDYWVWSLEATTFSAYAKRGGCTYNIDSSQDEPVVSSGTCP